MERAHHTSGTITDVGEHLPSTHFASLLQVKNKREQLLSHPLVTFLLDYKWRKFGRYIYYTKLALFCIFLLFLTGYTVYSTENAPKCNGTIALSSNVDKDSAPYILWIRVGRIVILALASWHILSEVGISRIMFCTWNFFGFGRQLAFMLAEFYF